jgi:hypothetical protein
MRIARERHACDGAMREKEVTDEAPAKAVERVDHS